MATEREAWLALTTEDAIDPDLPICDPHHHLMELPNNRYLLEDFLGDTGGGHDIVNTVFVEWKEETYRKDGPEEMRPVGETAFVMKMIAQRVNGRHGTTDVAAGIVGYADLALGAAVAPVLEAHIAAGMNRFRGVRYNTNWDASPEIRLWRARPKGLLSNPTFREGFACLQKYGLSFDAELYFPQLMELVDLARAFPKMSIIVNHIGGLLGIGPYAGKRDEVFQVWRHGMTALAACPNVNVKLGGLGMMRCGFGWHDLPKPPSSIELAGAMAIYYRLCIDLFGPERCMFESNFPVDKISYSYTVLWNAFKRIAKDYSPRDRAALFHDTAVGVYRLAPNSR